MHAVQAPTPPPAQDANLADGATIRAIGRDRWAKLAFDAWAYGAFKQAELIAEGIDPNARNCWGGVPTPNTGISATVREIRERGHDLDSAKAILTGAIDTAAAKARADTSLQYFTPSWLFDPKHFWKSADATPAQVTRRKGPQLVKPLRRDAPVDDEPDFGAMSPAERALYPSMAKGDGSS